MTRRRSFDLNFSSAPSSQANFLTARKPSRSLYTLGEGFFIWACGTSCSLQPFDLAYNVTSSHQRCRTLAQHLIPARPCLGPIVFQILRARRLKENKRADKWRTMIDSFDEWRRGRKAKRLRNRVRKGVPDCVRGKVWQMLSGSTVSVFFAFGAEYPSG